LRARAKRRGHDIKFSITSLKMLLPVSFYNGYFGAGSGVLMLGVMSVATGGDYRSANVAKNLITSLNCAGAAAVFIARGSVIWPQTLALMAGTIAGGETITLNGGRFFGTTATSRVQFTAGGITRDGIVTAITANTVTVQTPGFPELTAPSTPAAITLTLGTNLPAPVVLSAPNPEIAQ